MKPKPSIQNISRGPLTIICNSGKAIHMAPEYSCEINEVDLKANPMIKKLLDRKLIRRTDTRTAERSRAKSTPPDKKAKATEKA